MLSRLEISAFDRHPRNATNTMLALALNYYARARAREWGDDTSSSVPLEEEEEIEPPASVGKYQFTRSGDHRPACLALSRPLACDSPSC